MQTNNGWRDALGWILRMAWEVDTANLDSGEAVKNIAAIAETTLKDRPPRNCDVGTAEEQAKRFEEYCESEVCKRKRCKSRAKALCIERCALEWAQKPYKEGGAK